MTGVAFASPTTRAAPRIRLPRPHSGQRHVMQGARRFNVLCAGRRWRKTTMLVSVAVLAAIERPGPYLWGAPTYDQTINAFNEARRALGGAGKTERARLTLRFPGGGSLAFRSMQQYDNLRGRTAYGVIFDEAPYIDEDAWAQVIRPMLLDSGGWAWLAGTPNGRNWFWQAYEHAGTDGADEWARWSIPVKGFTVRASGELVRTPHPHENPDIPAAEVAALWQSMTEQDFRQEILAQFVEQGGLVFRRVDEAIADVWREEPHERGQYVMGIDWGMYDDYTALAIVDTRTDACVYCERYNMVDTVLQLQRVRALYDRFRPYVVRAERNAMGEPLVSLMAQQGYPLEAIHLTNAIKHSMVRSLSLALEQGRVRLPAHDALISELKAYTAERRGALLAYSAPSGQHDDLVMALLYAWSGHAPYLSAFL